MPYSTLYRSYDFVSEELVAYFLRPLDQAPRDEVAGDVKAMLADLASQGFLGQPDPERPSRV